MVLKRQQYHEIAEQLFIKKNMTLYPTYFLAEALSQAAFFSYTISPKFFFLILISILYRPHTIFEVRNFKNLGKRKF